MSTGISSEQLMGIDTYKKVVDGNARKGGLVKVEKLIGCMGDGQIWGLEDSGMSG